MKKERPKNNIIKLIKKFSLKKKWKNVLKKAKNINPKNNFSKTFVFLWLITILPTPDKDRDTNKNKKIKKI